MLGLVIDTCIAPFVNGFGLAIAAEVAEGVSAVLVEVAKAAVAEGGSAGVVVKGIAGC